jgi:hypothetical protein
VTATATPTTTATTPCGTPPRPDPPARTWPWYALAGAAALLALVTLGGARQASTARADDEQLLAARRDALDAQRRDLRSLQARIAHLEVEAFQVQQARALSAATVATAQESLATTQRELDGARLTQASQDARLLAIRTCLGGARRALDATTVGDSSRAVLELRAVTAACTQALARRDGDSPVYEFDFADPYVLRAGSALYAFATNAGGGTVQVLRSSDARSWSPAGSALTRQPGWARPGTTWAPAVLQRGATFVLYYATRQQSTNRQCLSTAVATSPAGPYVDDTAGPLECGTRGAIDASPFVAPDGTAYLLWKQEPNLIVGQQLAPDGRALVGERRTLLAPSRGWEGGNVEAPSMLVSGGRYWLFYSANDWNGRRYVQGMAGCAGPLGPCRADGAPFLQSHGTVAGPGGGEAFQDLAGHWQLAYHAYREPAVGYPNSRLMHVAPLTLDGSGRPAVG